MVVLVVMLVVRVLAGVEAGTTSRTVFGACKVFAEIVHLRTLVVVGLGW